MGYETDTGRFKFGDGTTPYNSLPYASTKILSTTGTPGAGVGVNGDYAIDKTSMILYGPKAAGSWTGTGTTMVGSQGIQGIQGNPGTPGSNGSNGIGVPSGGSAGTFLRNTGGGGSKPAWAIPSLSELATMANNRVLGNVSGSTGAISELTPTQLTALVNAVTSSLPGAMSVQDKKKLDSGFINACFNPYSNIPTDGTTDIAPAWDALIAAVPDRSVIFWPNGQYTHTRKLLNNLDKHVRNVGSGKYTTLFRNMSTTDHCFEVSGLANQWQNSFEDMGFLTGVTKTDGAAIYINCATAPNTNVARIWVNGYRYGIHAVGAQAGNLSIWDSLDIAGMVTNGRGVKINGNTINVVISNSTINGGPTTFAVAGSACVEVNQSGAVQCVGNDFIGAVNTILLNADQGGSTSIAACYFTNCFFDQAGGSTIKVMGANTTNRIKFTQCGIAAGLVGTNAVEIAGTGSGAVGGPTAMPAGISLVDCDIYYAPGSSTAAGILVNGCQDINIQSCRIAGFSGAGGCGISVIPSPLNQTKVRINGNIIGPNSNLTINNETAIKLVAGSTALAALSITDNTLIGNGTAINDTSAVLATTSKNIKDNTGCLAGLSTQYINAAGQALSATELIVLQIPLPANSIKVGTTFKFTITGTAVGTVRTTARLHIGTGGVIGDAQIITTAVSAAGVAGGFMASGTVTIKSVGGAGTGNGAVHIQTGTAASAPAITATGTFNSAIANFVSVGLLCSAAGHTVHSGTLEIVSPS